MKNILHKTIYNKILLQAQEAKFLGLVKLSNDVLSSIGPVYSDEKENYSFDALDNKIDKLLWEMLLEIIKYYDLESVDIQKCEGIIKELKENSFEKIKEYFDLPEFGPLEEKVFGEK